MRLNVCAEHLPVLFDGEVRGYRESLDDAFESCLSIASMLNGHRGVDDIENAGRLGCQNVDPYIALFAIAAVGHA